MTCLAVYCSVDELAVVAGKTANASEQTSILYLWRILHAVAAVTRERYSNGQLTLEIFCKNRNPYSTMQW